MMEHAPAQVVQRQPAAGQVLRKCACGGKPGPSGDCAECRRARGLRTRRAAGRRALLVSRPGEPLEQEAERTAHQVMRTQPSPESVVRRHPAVGVASPPASVAAPEVSGSSGGPLDARTRAFMEPRFGYSFGDVRIHTDGAAERAAQSLGAQAFTHGMDIFFGAGSYRPATRWGRQLIAHELTHTLQQGPGVYRVMSPACTGTNRYPGNLAHELIEDYYTTVLNPISAKEFSIPGSGGMGGVGYADFVDLAMHAIYEIKPYTGGTQGVVEAANYATHAALNCDPSVPWIVGLLFPDTVIPATSTQELVAKQYLGQQPGYPTWPGVVVYYFRNRRRQPVRQPVRVPQWVLDLLLLIFLAFLAVLVIIALIEPTPIGEAILVAAAILILINMGILDEATVPATTGTLAGVTPEEMQPPPFETGAGGGGGGGGLRDGLVALAAANSALLERLRDPTSVSVDDVRTFVGLGHQVIAQLNQADPEDPFVIDVRAAMAQIQPLASRALGSSAEEGSEPA